MSLPPTAASEDEILVFRRRLAETIAWCARRASAADPQTSLRSPALRPASFGDYRQSQQERQAIVEAVAERRAELLRQAGQYPETPALDLAGGRLLICNVDESVGDAVSGLESRGFFDEVDIAPWDTWIGYRREPHPFPRVDPDVDYLLCWVPPQLIPLVGAGIDINPVDCIFWATKDDTLFTCQLHAAGLLG